MPSAEKFDLPGVLHGHAQCYDLVKGPHATWAIGGGSFIDYEGNELGNFGEAVDYHVNMKRDVFVWWETVACEPPDGGWKDDKDLICSVSSCYGFMRSACGVVCCISCPRSYHLHCIDVYVENPREFSCSMLGTLCTDRFEPILKPS